MDEAAFRADAPVIIVGGGPVGLSLALGLARYGVRSTVLERAFEPARESRAAVIWPRTQDILRDWNAFDALRAAGSFVTAFRALNACNEATLLSIDFAALDDVLDDPGALLLPQSDTERILRALVTEQPLCELRLGAEVTGLRQEARFVDVAFTQDGRDMTLRAPYVVGCDGAHGIVRNTLGLSLEGMTYKSRIVLSDAVLDRDFDEDARVRVCIDQPGVCAAIRFAPRTWRVIASVDETVDADIALSEEAQNARIHRVFGEASSQTLWTSLFKIHRRHAQRFVVGRVALAGDAAHLNSPAGGQGMNAGIQDAANLAWKLAWTLRSGDRATTLLESYDVERREMVTDTIERATDRLTRIALGFSPRTKRFAARTMWRAVRGRGMQRKLGRALGMLSGRYTRSPIVDSRHPLAGRRIDDLRLPDGPRIHQQRDGEAAIVVAGDFACSLPHIRVPSPPKRWHVKLPAVLIVRPDGCVASVVEKPTLAKVEAAWAHAFCGTIPLPVYC